MSLEGQHPVNLNTLYQQVILDHYKKPRNKGEQLVDATMRKHLHNPTCGDDLEVSISLDADGKIDDVKWNGRGCSISMSSASMMSVALRGKTLDEAQAMMTSFYGMMKGEEGSYKSLGELQALSGVSKFPVRIKCATLAWHCLEEGMKESAQAPQGAGRTGESVDGQGGSANGF
ncbi:MAG TPA: SUF system NifU family Fe-S cluster assembly protein [Symbiobacteriaceae bacterium]|nr:SUF system NifU family Fe-S cluster assembly protein [Symbiobacteriaceae bacterium]